MGREPDIDPRPTAVFHFIIGPSPSKGVAKITIPVGNMWFGFRVHVFDKNIPFLMSIDYLHRLGLFTTI